MSLLRKRLVTLARIRHRAASATAVEFLACKRDFDVLQERRAELVKARSSHEAAAGAAIASGCEGCLSLHVAAAANESLATGRPELWTRREDLEHKRAALVSALRARDAADVLLERLRQSDRLEAHRAEVKQLDELQQGKATMQELA